MLRIALATAALTLSAGAVLAQPTSQGTPMGTEAPMTHHGSRAGAMPMHRGESRREMPTRRGETRGRSAATGSDAAYNGGGVILEGPPGAPAPMPQAFTPAPGGGTVVQVPASGMSQSGMRGAPMR